MNHLIDKNETKIWRHKEKKNKEESKGKIMKCKLIKK